MNGAPGARSSDRAPVATAAGGRHRLHDLVPDERNVKSYKTKSYISFFLLRIALLITLGFEFVNGFHDAANAIATLIYTNS